MATDISVNKKSVRELLESGKDKTFVIPEYQKSYAWTLEESEKLFDDLWNFSLNLGDIEYPHTTYFLGSMVAYMNSRGEQEIRQ